jgi:hypothetical protein
MVVARLPKNKQKLLQLWPTYTEMHSSNLQQRGLMIVTEDGSAWVRKEFQLHELGKTGLNAQRSLLPFQFMYEYVELTGHFFNEAGYYRKGSYCLGSSTMRETSSFGDAIHRSFPSVVHVTGKCIFVAETIFQNIAHF